MATELMESTDRYAAEFARLGESLSGSRLPWLRKIRETAITRFLQLGFPTRRLEEWRHTDVTPIARTAFQYAPAARPRGVDPKQIDGAALGTVSSCRM